MTFFDDKRTKLKSDLKSRAYRLISCLIYRGVFGFNLTGNNFDVGLC